MDRVFWYNVSITNGKALFSAPKIRPGADGGRIEDAGYRDKDSDQMEHEPYKNTSAAEASRLGGAAIIVVACICGWIVMQLEVLGVRVLAPYFGSAVYVVMGSVIGVFLLSLSAGYMLGGWLSRKADSRGALGMSLMAAGVWLCAVPFFAEAVCEGIFNAGLDEKWGSLLAAFILFCVPTLLLGTVSPTVVRRLTRRASEAGLNAGLVLALSTAASFAGCVVTAFWLVLFSLRLTICVTGAVLLAVGSAILLQRAIADRSGASSELQGGGQ